MRRRTTFLFLAGRLTLLFCVAAPMANILALCSPAQASRIGSAPVEPLVREADAIAVAEILEVKIEKERIGGKVCTSTTTLTLAARRFIRGHLPEGTELTFRYKIMHDDRRPCHRLYEVHAPRARLIETGEKRGVELIATIRRKVLADGKAVHEVTSTYDMDDLGKIRKLAGE